MSETDLSVSAAAALAEGLTAVGGGAALAEALRARGCSISRHAIYQWRMVPPRHVLAVEEITGIPRHRLRPDYYPPEPAAAANAEAAA
jgi:DNA-binding transcriptional regulator YdaS (Cro superfamily)